jgi:hypothetical protein
MAEIEWPLEKDAGSSWHLIVAYHSEGYGSSRGGLTQSVDLLRRLAEVLALRGNFSFATVCECRGVSVHCAFSLGGDADALAEVVGAREVAMSSPCASERCFRLSDASPEEILDEHTEPATSILGP